MINVEELAERVIQQAVLRGVAEFVLCPGSRNSPLLAEALRSGLACWGHMDERAAAFFALGRCRDLDRPVAVITTSGTAAFEAFPAVIEALYQRLPLLVITADRPKRFRGTGAPQAIEQAGMFCVYAVSSLDTEDGRLNLENWDGWGPAHVNVCLDEPLLQTASEERDGVAPEIPSAPWEGRPRFRGARRCRISTPDVVLVGSLHPSDRAEVKGFLRTLRRPVLAEATSGLREDADLAAWMLRDGEHSLGSLAVHSVLRVGGVPSLRFWRDLEGRKDVAVCNVLANGFPGLARDCRLLDELSQVEIVEERPRFDWTASRRREARLEELLRAHPRSEPALVRALSVSLGAGASVFLGNSLPVREWNLAASREDRGVDCWANRGANGIEGNVSAWLGWSALRKTESWGIFGDLTALYDLNALWVREQVEAAPRRLVVVNNGGGGIFRRIPGLSAASGELRRMILSEHRLGFAPWAEMWNCGYHLWESGGGAVDGEGLVIVEVRPDEDETERFWAAWSQERTEGPVR